MAAPLRADADAQTGKAAANHQNICVDYLHGLTLFVRISLNKSEIRISKSEINHRQKIPKSENPKHRNEGCFDFGYFCHLKLFRISGFVLRIFFT
jgi:hypothetical protein